MNANVSFIEEHFRSWLVFSICHPIRTRGQEKICFYVCITVHTHRSLLYFLHSRGNLDRAIELFNKAIALVRTETELAQTFSLREAAKAQKYVTETLGLTPPTMPLMP